MLRVDIRSSEHLELIFITTLFIMIIEEEDKSSNKISRRKIIVRCAALLGGLSLASNGVFSKNKQFSARSRTGINTVDDFITEDFLLYGKTAKTLYHEHAKNLPIIDYHSHLPPSEI